MDRDDFEFKPLTDGLGFHKKKTETNRTKSSINNESSPFSRPSSHMSSTTLSRNESMNFIENETERTTEVARPSRLHRPKGREIPIIEDEIAPGNKAVDDILKTFKHTDLDFDTKKAPVTTARSTVNTEQAPTSIKLELKSTKKAKAQEQNKITFELEKTHPLFMANVLDTMLILAATMLCMIALLTVTKIDLLSHITNTQSDPSIYIALLGLFLSVVLTYNLVTRVFMQATPGEWAFDLQLGHDEQAHRWSYPLKVMARTVVYSATGFIFIAMISRLMKKDLVGELVNLSLYKKV